MVVFNDSIVDSISHTRWSNTYIGDVLIFFKCVKICFKNEHFSTNLHVGLPSV